MIYRARYWNGDDLVRTVEFSCPSPCLVEEALDAAMPNPPEHDVVTVAPRIEQ